MVKENFKLFLQVINTTIIGDKQILKMLHDYFYLVVNYVLCDSESSIMLIALSTAVTGFLMHISKKQGCV